MFDKIERRWLWSTIILWLMPGLVFLAALMLFSCAVGYWIGANMIK